MVPVVPVVLAVIISVSQPFLIPQTPRLQTNIVAVSAVPLQLQFHLVTTRTQCIAPAVAPAVVPEPHPIPDTSRGTQEKPVSYIVAPAAIPNLQMSLQLLSKRSLPSTTLRQPSPPDMQPQVQLEANEQALPLAPIVSPGAAASQPIPNYATAPALGTQPLPVTGVKIQAAVRTQALPNIPNVSSNTTTINTSI